MNRQDILFSTVFALGVGLLLYAFGVAVTGNVVQSMYCKDGSCKDFCQFNTDCIQGEVCCSNDGFGVCEERMNCISEYELSIDQNTNLDYEKRSPSTFPIVFPILGVIIITILIVIMLSKKKPQPKKKSKT